MIDQIPFGWLVNQDVPLLFFIVALLTNPSIWTNIAIEKISKFYPQTEGKR